MKPKAITEKTNLHPRNLHKSGYDFVHLNGFCPELKKFVAVNQYGIETIDFSNPEAVKTLNSALLSAHYDIQNWDIPENYLCPPVPGRADYIHHIADLLASVHNGIIPEGDAVFGLDIGIGANCIYPIIGNAVYGWNFVGTDIDAAALENCVGIIERNPGLHDAISLQLQPNARFIFKDIILPEDRFAFTICNPPFHASEEAAAKGALRKHVNLGNKKTDKVQLNFSGHGTELWCEGGELAFITQMIHESAKYPLQCLWFTALVSKKAHLSSIEKTLNKVNAATVKTIEMAQGQKNSRFIAWTFLSETQQRNWKF